MNKFSLPLNYKLKLLIAPVIEPVTLTEIKEHLRIDSGTIATNITNNQSIIPDEYTPQTIEGTEIDVIGAQVLVIINAGTFVAGGTVDAKLQESDDNIIYTDVVNGNFPQITDATDNQIFEKEYTGKKQYLRVHAIVGTNNCKFSADIILSEPDKTEDNLISAYNMAARRYIEKYCGRALITQTYQLFLDRWPENNQFNEWRASNGAQIILPRPPLQSVTSIKYYGENDTEYTFSSDDYEVDNVSEFFGRIATRADSQWPSENLRILNPIKIEFIAGYGDNASDVPEEYKLAIKMLVGHFYENREATAINKNIPDYIKLGIKEIIGIDSVNII